MKDNGDIDGISILIGIIVVLFIIVAILVFLPSPPTPKCCDTDNKCYNYDGCGSKCSTNQDANITTHLSSCIDTKTATIYIVNEGLSNHIVDSYGCEFDWKDDFIWKFDAYNGHNVTFMYDHCNTVRGRYRIMSVLQDNSICGCGTCQKN